MIELARKLNEQIKFENDYHEHFPGRRSIFTFPTIIRGGSSINRVPDLCEAYGEIRYLPCHTEKEIETKINEILKDFDCKYEKLVSIPAYISKINPNIVFYLQRKIYEQFGIVPQIGGSGPACDMWMFGDSPSVTFGPPGENAHAPNECVYIDGLVKVYKIYLNLALDFYKLIN
jgi:succinyl-diaminopimelate desuccinylase